MSPHLWTVTKEDLPGLLMIGFGQSEARMMKLFVTQVSDDIGVTPNTIVVYYVNQCTPLGRFYYCRSPFPNKNRMVDRKSYRPCGSCYVRKPLKTLGFLASGASAASLLFAPAGVCCQGLNHPQNRNAAESFSTFREKVYPS